ncbi:MULTISPECIES: 2-hydroxy-3-oxopropionate reductase [unclassified Glutamicibacter]|uniref:2-hydroxy-3-oxopropionate reductase n=1 Tax=Glutamicibacter TaxID=1742989 RepID=UPI000BB8ACA7|nr:MULTISPECIES: 2-hydroxy-3-oxopropionate reductase [unclassified Glutamicibacter]PCC27745.1 2-hydroxy-3-oxopropionate reductase [Glutamicibacter sp. BW80]PCC37208.1 2-hydroxy-3-oxopropionate reductase [Glutamicibacter sp. BW77]
MASHRRRQRLLNFHSPLVRAAKTLLENHMSQNVAFIGLGIMGLPMAKNLVTAGFNVTGFNRSEKAATELAAAGGHAANSIAEAVKDADVIITMVPDSPDVEAVTTGAEGLFAHAKSGAIWIDNSSIRPDVAVHLSNAAREAGLRPLDAPVSGGEQGAIDAVLSIMVGGEPADFAVAKPVLEAVGKTIVLVGPSGSGQTVKAANQLIVAANIQALSEAVVFLEAYGVDTDSALKVLGGGLAGSKVLEQKGQKILDREFGPGFRLALHHKDMGIVTSAAREAGVVLPMGSLVAQLVGSTVASGDGALDHSGLFRGVQRLSGQSQ